MLRPLEAAVAQPAITYNIHELLLLLQRQVVLDKHDARLQQLDLATRARKQQSLHALLR